MRMVYNRSIREPAAALGLLVFWLAASLPPAAGPAPGPIAGDVPAVGEAPATGAVAIDPAESVFAVVTHKAGVAARLAHDHLITAEGATLQFDFHAASPAASRFTLTTEAARLGVDLEARHRAWFPKLQRLGILESPGGEVTAKDRKKIRKAMLSKGQLNEPEYPTLRAEVLALEPIPPYEPVDGAPAFSYRARLRLEVAGRKVVQPVYARHSVEDGRITVEAFGTFRFEDFGIKPYSALLGAIRNDDTFHVYAYLVAEDGGGGD